MSSYRKTMGEVYNGMYLVEGNIDKIKDIVSKKSASKIDGVMVDMFTASAISQIYDKVNDANKKKMEKLPIIKLAALAMKMMKNEYVPEEAVSMAQQAAIAISKKERGNKPKKEEVKLDELKPPSRHVGKSQKNPDMFAVYDQEEKEVELFKDKKDAEEYAVKNHDALMGHDKPKNVKEEVECDCDCGKSPCEKCGQDHHGIAEEVELDEHKGTEPHKHPHPKDVDEASARSDAMKAMRKGKSIDPADVDNVASDDDVKAASKNIMMQLRKAINLRGTMAVEFGDKKKVKVSAKIAQAATSKYNSFRRPADKEKFQAKIAKSYKDMLKALKESTIKESKFGIINKQLKGEK